MIDYVLRYNLPSSLLENTFPQSIMLCKKVLCSGQKIKNMKPSEYSNETKKADKDMKNIKSIIINIIIVINIVI